MTASVSLPKALWRGFAMKCPNRAQGDLFGRMHGFDAAMRRRRESRDAVAPPAPKLASRELMS